ncbi:PREDICTED: uncharacterized protein LOC107165041 [Diuraphis noxia]|uniref:uncharacterized protein LOC107165041 n=1 Tax=Diuraphis noxia TaxID=143948 RepID=UPI0007637289|nr:PREDICTED: uncharacterized protein LOC107165041 [Diuraphis noxia]
MTQALTGHGFFQWYLHRMDRATSTRCWQCADDSDIAEHTLFQCVYLGRIAGSSNLPARSSSEHHRRARHNLWSSVRDSALDPFEKQTVLIEAEEAFTFFYRMVENILPAKEDEERRRQAAERPPDSPN